MSNAEPNFTGGGTVFGYIVSQWQALFGAKVDAVNGILTTPTITTPTINGGTINGSVIVGLTFTGVGQFITAAITVNFNVAGDNVINVPLPSGFTQFRVVGVFISQANGSLTTATFGVFTGTAGTGSAIVTPGTAPTVANNTPNTNNNFESVVPNNGATEAYTPDLNGDIYFRVGTTVNHTAKVSLVYQPVP